MNKPLTVYKASAGSGKTFTLATEYIRLVVENPLCYRNILAVTFTNKATEEMKMRILSQLYGIWKQLPDSDDYMRATCEKTGMPKQLVSQRAGMALDNLLHHYSEFRVMTIDTFFQGVLRNLAKELDLTANLRIGLNDIQVEELAVDQLIESLNTSDVMLQWLMKYILENISDDKSWNVIGQIKQFGRTIFHDEYKAVSQQLSKKLEEPDFFERYSKMLKDIREAALQGAKSIATEFFDILDDEGLSVEDFSFGTGGVCGFFLKLRDGIFDESIFGKRVENCDGDPAKWYKKSHPRAIGIHSLVASKLAPLLHRAIKIRPILWRSYKSADLTLRHLNQVRLLNSIEHKVRELNEEANRFLLSDTQQLLHALIDGSDSPFIFEKIGTQLEHIMIDEFQDTSTVQWKNFKVLLLEAMSHEGAENLIVGDVKQSIYRWRSGDWRLLNDISSEFPHPEEQVKIEPLDTNYRSERRVIEFNNAFFTEAAELEYLALNETTEAHQLRRAYEDVKQKIPEKRDNCGLVKITLLPGEDYLEQTLQQLVDTVTQMMEAGIQPQAMAILVRTNAYIPIIAQYFMEHLPEVSIVSDEAFRLDASVAVNLLIAALQVLAQPADQLARAALVKLYQHHVLQNSAPENELLLQSQNLDALLPDTFTNHLYQLRTMSLYELAERLYTLFELSSLEGQSAYICAFFDHLSDFLTDHVSGIGGFLREWEESLCGKTIQSDELGGIRIISIHKSKGLEFDHVMIPFCDWQLEKPGNILWCQPKEEPFSELPIAPVDFSAKQMTGTIYEDDYRLEHLQTTVDNLNLLYVAFTRASRSLWVIGRRNAKCSRSMLIEQTLPQLLEKRDYEMTDATLEGMGDEKSPITFSYGSLASVTVKAEKSKNSENPFLTESKPLPIKMASYANKVEFRQSNRSATFLETEEDDAEGKNNYIQLGSILHQVFSTIRTTDDIDEALLKLQLEGILYDDDNTAERITAMLRKRLEHPKVAEWFSPGSDGKPRWLLYNECSILTVEDGKLKERRPDRVMTDGKQWVIVDFKFGKPNEAYKEQVKDYMSLLNAMGHHNVSGYLWYVYSNKIVEV